LQAAGDARIEIQEALNAPAGLAPAAPSTPVRQIWRRALVPGLVCLVAAAIAALAAWSLKLAPQAPTPPVTRTVITLPAGQQLAGSDDGSAVALSPDGTHLAYVATQGSRTQQLYLRAMDGLEARSIPGTEGTNGPFFSPDGQWMGFFAGSSLKKVSVNGGAVVTLGNAAGSPRGASWGSQGMIAFATNTEGPALMQVSDAGGSPQPLTRLEKGVASHRWPEFLPGGKAVLFFSGAGGIGHGAVLTVGTGEVRNLTEAVPQTQLRYAPSGHLVYEQGGTLMAAPFDFQRLTATGAPVRMVEGVQQSSATGAAQYSISATGSLVYVTSSVEATQRRLVWVSRNGTEQPLAAPAHAYRQPRLSRDGRRVAVGIEEPSRQIWLYDLSRETLTRLTFEGSGNTQPEWTPDGKRVAFISNKEGPQNIFWQLADGSGGLERLTTSDYAQTPMSWSSDGQLLAFIEINPTTSYDIWVLPTGPGQVRKPQPFLRTTFNESVPRFSPDGHWMAYISDESGRYEVYVQSYPGPGGKWQISTEGGMEPVWNPNGRELFYRSGDKMMAVDIVTQPIFAAGKPHVLFEGQYMPTPTTSPNYDVSPDGQRFLMIKESEQAPSATQIVVVQNWFEELKQKVPVGKK